MQGLKQWTWYKSRGWYTASQSNKETTHTQSRAYTVTSSSSFNVVLVFSTTKYNLANKLCFLPYPTRILMGLINYLVCKKNEPVGRQDSRSFLKKIVFTYLILPGVSASAGRLNANLVVFLNVTSITSLERKLFCAINYSSNRLMTILLQT